MNAWPYPFWIAHRGGGRLAPENTLAAFRVGAAHGFRAFECDVKLSADGVPFLLHDETLARTTGADGVAGERPWAELSRLDAGGWHGSAFAGEPPASLEAVAAYVLRNGFALNLELKPAQGHERETGHSVAQAAARLWQGVATPPLLSSFRVPALEGALEGAPALPRGLLLDQFWDGWLDTAQALGCAAVITEHGMMDRALRERLHGAGLRALVYTVNDAETVQRMREAGVDGLFTDALDSFSPH